MLSLISPWSKQTVASNIVTMLAQNLLYLKAAELQSSGNCGIKVAIIMIITQRLVYYHLSGHSSSRETARSRDVYSARHDSLITVVKDIRISLNRRRRRPPYLRSIVQDTLPLDLPVPGRTTRTSSSFTVRTARGPVNWVMKRPRARRIRYSRGPDHRFVPSGSGGRGP